MQEEEPLPLASNSSKSNSKYQQLLSLYDKLSQQKFQEQPYSLDYLLQTFSWLRKTVTDTHRINRGAEVDLEHSFNYMDQKERMILEVNKKKNMAVLKKQLQGLNVTKNDLRDLQRFEQMFRNAKDMYELFQHGTCPLVQAFVSKVIRLMVKLERHHNKKKENKLKELKATLCNREYQYEMLTEHNQALRMSKKKKEKQYQEHKKKDQKLDMNMVRLKNDVKKLKEKMQKKLQKQAIQAKQQQQRLSLLRQQVYQLQLSKRENELQLRRARKDDELDPGMARIQQRLEVLNLQCTKLQSKKPTLISKVSGKSQQSEKIHDITFA